VVGDSPKPKADTRNENVSDQVRIAF